MATGTTINSAHIYTHTGQYTVSLQITDGAFTAVVSKTRYVAVGQARSIEYEYDELYRLIEADYTSGEYFAYEYDAVGNRKTYTATITQTTVITYDYDHADRLVRVGDVDYTWDELGRLGDDGTRQYAWDAAGRLISVTSGADTTLFGYNGDGDRLSKTVNGTLTTYTLDVAAGLPQVLVEHSGASRTSYLYGLDLIGEQGAAWAYHLNDGLGSVRQLVDGSGQVTLAQGARPFGAPLWQAGSGSSGFGFTGEQVDASTGLVFLRARYYAPGVGRFLSLDPWSGTIWHPGTLNKYNYVIGNPIGSVDPSGRQSECPSHHNATSQCHPPEPVWPPYDPLLPHLWSLAKEKARLFQIPVELVAGTIATEIVHDTDWHDPILDDLLENALLTHYCSRDGTWELDMSKNLLDGFLSGYDNYWGYFDERGPGPGVANVHVGTAKDAENYFVTHYPDQHLLDPPPDHYDRMWDLLHDKTNVHYTAAILRQLADLRKGKDGEPLKRPHLHDLNDWDMQIIYGAFRAGIDKGYGGTINYQNAVFPGKFGKQIAPYLSLYRDKYRIERVLNEIP